MMMILCMQLIACVKEPGAYAVPLVPDMAAVTAGVQAEMPPVVQAISADVNWAISHDATKVEPAGVLISEEKAAQVQELWVRYEELRSWTQWSLVQREYAEYQCTVRVGDLEAWRAREEWHTGSWWERNRSSVMFGAGVGFGVLATTAAGFGVYSAVQLSAP